MDLPVAILIILGAAAVAALALAVVQRRVTGPLFVDSGRGRPMVTVTGTLFAVVLAFVILAAFQTYTGARTGAASEADALLDMARTAALYPPAQRNQLRSDFTCYGRAVVEVEWPAMRRERSSALVEYWVGAYRAAFGQLDVRSARDQVGFQDLLTQAATRTTGRQQRLSDDAPTVPTPLWVALIFGGCIAVALHLGMADPREKLYVHGLMMAGIAAVVTAGLLIVYFLDHPYARHAGGIEPTAMQQTLGLMRDLEPGLRPACTASGRLL